MRNRQRWIEVGLYLLICALFLIANRGAYQGYFSDDDFDNIAMNRLTGWEIPVHELFSFKLTPVYRPWGAIWQLTAGSLFNMHFVPYVAAVQLMHLLNVALLWLFLRRAGLPQVAIFAGALFYSFHFAAVAAYWQPMYVFDVLCGSFCLLTLVLYQRGHHVLALVAFWLAFKSKELAILLPLALVAYEYWLGERRWMRLVPFFVVSLAFGIQASYRHRQQDDYALHYEPLSLLHCLNFYLKALTGIPLAGLLILALVLELRSPLARLGLIVTAVLIAPMLLVPGRLNSVYWYVPLLGVAMIIAAAAVRWPKVVLAAFLLWLPWNNHFLKIYRRSALPVARSNREYINAVRYAWEHYYGPRPKVVIIDGQVNTMRRWGVDGALRLITRDPDFKIYDWGSKEASAAVNDPVTLQFTWNQSDRHLAFGRTADLTRLSYIDMGTQAAGNSLGDGWYPLDGRFRWSRPQPEIKLVQISRKLILVTSPNADELKFAHQIQVQALADGLDLGTRTIVKDGVQILTWAVPPPPGGADVRHIEFHITPTYHPSNGDPRELGLPVLAAGFVAETAAGKP